MLKQVVFAMACLLVAVLSLLPAEALPPAAFSMWDKAQHASAFAWLTVCGLWAYSHRPSAVVGALLVYGALIEIAQSATGWRYGDWHDWLADAVGVVLGIMICRGVTCRMGKANTSPKSEYITPNTHT